MNLNATIPECIEPSLFPFTGNDAGLGLAVLIISFLASVGGVGGGGILIPLITLITDICLERTIPLVVMMVFSNSITRALVFFRRRYPEIPTRYLVNYDILLIMLPFSSNFSIFGLLLNISMPVLVTTVFLVFVMIVMLCIVINKGIFLLKEERKQFGEEERHRIDLNEINLINENENENDKIETKSNDSIQTEITITSKTDPLQVSLSDTRMSIEKDITGEIKNLASISSSIIVSDTGIIIHPDIDPILIKKRERWEKEHPKDAVISLVLLGIAIGFIGIFAGLRQVFTLCSLEYWLMIGFQIVVILIYVAFVIMYVYWRIEKRQSVNFPRLPKEPNITPKLITILAGLGIFLGLIGTYIGIGGGIAIGPVLLALGVDIRMVIATNTTAILFTSFVSSIQYISRGLVYWDYAIYCCILASIGAGLAIIVNDKIEKKWNRRSYLAFVLAMLMTASTIMLIYNGLTKFDIIPIKFNDIC